MPKVYNKRNGDAPEGAVYVGRPTKWGNPYSHQKGTLAAFTVSSRENAVKAFEMQIRQSPATIKAIKEELAGKDLVCWCAPAACHADVLLEIANE